MLVQAAALGVLAGSDAAQLEGDGGRRGEKAVVRPGVVAARQGLLDLDMSAEGIRREGQPEKSEPCSNQLVRHCDPSVSAGTTLPVPGATAKAVRPVRHQAR